MLHSSRDYNSVVKTDSMSQQLVTQPDLKLMKQAFFKFSGKYRNISITGRGIY